jgi:hypothetical protein
VHVALWCWLIAFVIFFCVFVLPQLTQSRAKMEAERILKPDGANAYSVCLVRYGVLLVLQGREHGRSIHSENLVTLFSSKPWTWRPK